VWLGVVVLTGMVVNLLDYVDYWSG
jgi:hypothetical protein